MSRRLARAMVGLGMITWMSASLAFPLGGGSLPAMGSPLPSIPTLPSEPLGAPLRLPPSLLDTPTESLSAVGPGLAKRLAILDSNGQTAHVEVQLENGWRAVEREWLLLLDIGSDAELSGTEQPLSRYVIEQRSLPTLGKVVVRLRVPSELDSVEALERILSPTLRQKLDRHHIFSPQTGAAVNAPEGTETSDNGVICPGPVDIGMIDTAIELDHPGLASERIVLVQRDFGPVGIARPKAHGTAVAGRMVGRGAGVAPLIGQTRLINASVFYGQDSLHQGAATVHLIQALEWLAAQGAQVINMSLAGPDNLVLHQAIKALQARNVSMVAAAGNFGPAAPPAYPAAYPEVIAVTAVDSAGQLYRWANRGEHIDFSAPGVRVQTTRAGGGFGPESGTSMAAPLVSAYFACALAHYAGDAERARRTLAERAEDLGAPERDAQYGHGLLLPAFIAGD